MNAILLAIAISFLLSVFASRLSEFIGLPYLICFLIIGMLAGSDGPGKIAFDNPYITQFIGTLALIAILFSGGLDTKWQDVKPVLKSGISLATLAVLISAITMALVSYYFLHLSLKESFLLGSIISSTDAAAIFSTFKSKRYDLKPEVNTLVTFESASNDPMAILLTMWTLHLFLAPTLPYTHLLFKFVLQIVVASGIGCLVGYGLPKVIDKIQLEQVGLYPVLTIGCLLLAYSVTYLLGGSGFLAVYLIGVIMGQKTFKHKTYLRRFHDGITWLMQIIIFLTLGLLVFPSELVKVLHIDLLIVFFLMFVARPLSVFAALSFSQLQYQDKLLIAWLGLRGAVSIILATFPMVAGLPNANLIFHLVFFIVLSSILLQGISIPFINKWLNRGSSS